MNDNRHDERASSAAAYDRAPISPQPDARSQRVASRRYVLLKGATRGAAILAAATPIKTLASNSSVTRDGLLCTISGIQSGVISAKTSLPICSGNNPDHYSDITQWPKYSKSNPEPTYEVAGRSFGPNTPFNGVFSGGSSKYLVNIMKNELGSSESHWITALLNAIAAKRRRGYGYVFPYSPKEVLDLYAGSQSADALAFFTDFMETP